MPSIQRFPIRALNSFKTLSNYPAIPRLYPPSSRVLHHRSLTMASASQLETLKSYTACDISDALLRLKVPNCGYLPDLNLYSPISPASPSTSSSISIHPASTVLFAPKTPLHPPSAEYGEPNIPSDKHWVDLSVPDTVVVISQPKGQICAVLGGIMALRMSVLGVKGVVVNGRVRDLVELRGTGLDIWGRGTSITGTGAQASPHALQVELDLDGTIVRPGDLVFCDRVNGVVIIPQEKVGGVVGMLPRLVEADERVKEAVGKGVEVREAFNSHRS